MWKFGMHWNRYWIDWSGCFAYPLILVGSIEEISDAYTTQWSSIIRQ